MSLESYQALAMIQQQLGPLKKDLRQLTMDVKKFLKTKQEAQNALVEIISAVNRKESSGTIKAIAVRGFRRSK